LQRPPQTRPGALQRGQQPDEQADSLSATTPARQQQAAHPAPQQRRSQDAPMDATAGTSVAAAAKETAEAAAAQVRQLQQQVQACESQLSALSTLPLTTPDEAVAVRTALDRGASAHMELGQVREELATVGTQAAAAQQQLGHMQQQVSRLSQQLQGCHIAVRTRVQLPRAQLKAMLCTASGVDAADLHGITLLSNSTDSEAEAALRLVRSQQGAPALPQQQQQRPWGPGQLRQQQQEQQQRPQEPSQQQQGQGQPVAPPGLLRPPPQPRQQQQQQGPGQPAAPPGLAGAGQQHPPARPSPPPPQPRPTQPQGQPQPLYLYRLKVASPEVAKRLVSRPTKHRLHEAGTGVYVEHWLTPSQLSARRNMRPFLSGLQERHIHWRWSIDDPLQVEQQVRAADGRPHWRLVHLPSPPSN
jgi:predicted  nucleic acid-binding Zn-ribbon protein